MKKVIILFSVIISFLLLLNIIFYNMYSNEYDTSSSFASQYAFLKESTQDQINLLQKNLSYQNNFIKSNCVDLNKIKNIADTDEVRSLASNYLISADKNAYNIQFKEIYSHGNLCSFTWNTFLTFESKDNYDKSIKGVAFLIIDPNTRELQHLNIMYCFYESDYTGSSPYSCNYNYYSNYIYGETKQDLINSINVN